MQPSKVTQHMVRSMEAVVTEGLSTYWSKPNIVENIRIKLAASTAFEELHVLHPQHAKQIENIITPKFTMCMVGAELKKQNQQAKCNSAKNSRKRK